MIQEPQPVRPGHLRKDIYYWKCDRPAAFHGTETQAPTRRLYSQVHALLQSRHPDLSVNLKDGGGQGNHRTFIATIGSKRFFVRIEDGPEQDDYIETESRIQEAVRACGVPVPQVFAADASRHDVPFAWQLMEVIPHPDLNHWHKQGLLNINHIAQEIGSAMAQWQAVPVNRFGPFQPVRENGFTGYHATYPDYFGLNLDRHLDFLTSHQFLSAHQAAEIRDEVTLHHALLELSGGCLVHKDLALWNILGSADAIAAFIDWDDSISGDPMDDLSLLACFHDGPVIGHTIEGYTRIKELPAEYRRRFWLHLLRNMIVKAVIRVGAGYFDRSDGFFLIGSGSSGADLSRLTMARIQTALDGLRKDRDPTHL